MFQVQSTWRVTQGPTVAFEVHVPAACLDVATNFGLLMVLSLRVESRVERFVEDEWFKGPACLALL